TLLSDFNKTISDNYGSLQAEWGFNMRGVSKRSAFIIDKNGLVQYAEVLDNASSLPDFEAIKKRLGYLAGKTL
ncbi:MAG: redoxin domain-containing protein, partial [Chitinophagales bacterium]|nr:redoxin domain-containing protein [Chitinophagales bacterium]